MLRPAVAEAAAIADPGRPIGLVAVGPLAAHDLELDRVAITYGDGRTLGDPQAPVQLTAVVRGDHPVPVDRPLPPIATRTAVHAAGDVLEAVAAVPADALPVVTTAWALSRLRPPKRRAFVDDLAAAGRTVAWVSVEGVGVAPGVPTLGDRPASGHSIVAVTVFGDDPPAVHVLGRCWSRGRWLSWLAPER